MCQYKDCGNERERDPIGVVWMCVAMREKGIRCCLVMCQYRDCGNERERDPIGVVWSGDVSI